MRPTGAQPFGALALAALPLLSSWACTGERWVVEAVAVLDAGAGTADGAAPVVCRDEGLGPPLPAQVRAERVHLGQWQGALPALSAQQQAALPSGPLQLDVGIERIVLWFGELASATPPPVADGGHLCPAQGPSSCTLASGLLAEHAYHAVEGFARNAILHLRFSRNEPWHGWCQLQTPRASPSTNGCPPTYSVEASYSSPRWGDSCSVERGERAVPIDCSRLTTLELDPCACNEEQCWAEADRRLELNLRWEQGAMRGTFWYGDNQAVELELLRR